MSECVAVHRLEHSPTLNTVLMVEDVLKNMHESIISMAELKRQLPKQINHNTLKIILIYLEQSNKIAVTMKGITWIFNPDPRLKKAINKGLEL
jgi:hypothetical protein